MFTPICLTLFSWAQHLGKHCVMDWPWKRIGLCVGLLSADGVMCAMQVRKASLHLPTDHFTLAVVTAVTVGCGQRAHTFGLCGCRALTRRCRLS